MKTTFIFVSSLLAFISPLIYAKAILKGQAKPHRTTRFVLLIITSLATASLFAQHDTVAVWLAGVSALQSILLFGLSIKHGMGGWAKTDILCLLIALAGIVIWQTTKDPSLALYASIAADFTGMLPAIIKTYKYPHTEIWSFFLLDVFAAIFSLLAVKAWTVQEFSYPLYIMIINSIMVLLIIRPKPTRKSI
ncbi:hypothetical protein KKE68_00090 [Patescibacteria group bacterium]|nr:hypothetical protein [Patescibacteria group bacterium]